MSNFKWAYDRNANIREPITNLKEKGWQYADIPTAGNVNWLFNQIEKNLFAIANELASLKESLNTEIATLKQDTATIRRTAKEALDKTIRHEEKIEWHSGVSRQICRGLRNMEDALSRRHSNFPTQPWPLEDDRVRTNAEEVVADHPTE
jgi:hypothetical protein